MIRSFVCVVFFGCSPLILGQTTESENVFVVVLGVAQDAGYPQTGCQKKCCQLAWSDPSERKHVSCVAVVDAKSKQRFMFDCSPDFPDQLRMLDRVDKSTAGQPLDGIFLTHGHMGHYTGLMHLGREAMGASNIPVHGTSRMNRFLKNNGPWSQLVKLENIKLNTLKLDQKIRLNSRISVTAFQVPHRDEFTDTVGFRIEGPKRSLTYLPDIDKWSKWDRSIEELIEETDIAMLDGTFFSNGEIPGRDMSLIPHPFVEESIKRFSALDADVRRRIKFIHLNHTNPAIQFNADPKKNSAARTIEKAGMGLARQGEVYALD